MVKPVRVTFGGCGKISSVHAKEVPKASGAKLRACWSRTRSKDELLAQRFDAAYVADDFAQIAWDLGVDTVCINTMHNDLFRILRPMADARKPVFTEKPLTHDAGTFRETHGLLGQRSIFSQAGYKTRFHALARNARETLPNPDVIETHVPDETWPKGYLNHITVAGGNVRSQGLYTTGILHQTAGTPPTAVTAISANMLQRSGIEGTPCACFELSNGPLPTISIADGGVRPIRSPNSSWLWLRPERTAARRFSPGRAFGAL